MVVAIKRQQEQKLASSKWKRP